MGIAISLNGFADSQGRGICLLIFWVFLREGKKKSEGKDRDRSVFNSGVMDECLKKWGVIEFKGSIDY